MTQDSWFMVHNLGFTGTLILMVFLKKKKIDSRQMGHFRPKNDVWIHSKGFCKIFYNERDQEIDWNKIKFFSEKTHHYSKSGKVLLKILHNESGQEL